MKPDRVSRLLSCLSQGDIACAGPDGPEWVRNLQWADRNDEAREVLDVARNVISPLYGYDGIGPWRCPCIDLIRLWNDLAENLPTTMNAVHNDIVEGCCRRIWPGMWGCKGDKSRRVQMLARLSSAISAFEERGEPVDPWETVLQPLSVPNYRREFLWGLIARLAPFGLPNDRTLPRFLAVFRQYCGHHPSPGEYDCAIEIRFSSCQGDVQLDHLIYRPASAGEPPIMAITF